MDTNKKPIDVSKLTPEQYQLEINKFNTQGQTPVNTAVPPVITSDMLEPQPELKLPEKAVPAPSPILAEADALVQTSLEKQAADAKKTQDTNVSDITQLMEAIGGVEGKRGQYQEEAGVFTNQDAIKEIDDQLLVQSRALKAKNEEIRRNPQLTQSMAARLMNEEERKAASTTADLMVTRSLLNRDVDRAIEIANRKVEAELAPLKTQLEAKKFVFDNNKDWLSTLQKTALETAIRKDEREYEKQETTKKEINKLLITAQQNGADLATINAIKNAKDVSEATVAIGKYASDPLERKIKEAQLSKLNQDMSIDRQNLALKIREANTITDIPQEELQVAASGDPVAFFSQVIKSNKIKGSQTLESLLGVIEASKALADEGIANGGFKGAAPIRLTPWFLKSGKQLSTQGQINAINLKVQQWASGAALTEKQTEQVKKFTPDTNDTDKQIRAKLNNLTNFMLSQGKSSLANQGVDITIPKVDLFENSSSVGDYLETVTGALNTSSMYGDYEL
jgi:hypothetical protein